VFLAMTVPLFLAAGPLPKLVVCLGAKPATAGRQPQPPARASSTVGEVTDTDAIAEHILATYDTITVVGASAAPAKAAHYVPAHMQQHGWRIIPVNPHADTILGEHVYRTLRDVPGQIGLVNVFRPPGETPDIARQAVAAGATALWLQLGIASPQARAIAEEAGLLYVEDRCLIIEQRRLKLQAPRPR
jgi:predicted CoA-binding protein